jgi:hypothetical protein
VVNTTGAAAVVKVAPVAVDPKVTTTSASVVPTIPGTTTVTDPLTTLPPTTGGSTLVTPTTDGLPPVTCAPPVAPSAVTLSALGPTVAVVRWSVASKNCLGGFRVQWGSNGTYLGGTDVGPSATEYTIGDLPAGATTDVDLFSIGNDGKVVDATLQSLHTSMPAPPASCPPLAPASPVIAPLGATAVMVGWTIASPECLTGFRVQWGANGSYLGGTNVGPGTSQQLITGFPPGTRADVDLFSIGNDGKVVDATLQRLSVVLPAT